MTQELLPFLFLNLAGIFVVIYMLLQRDKGLDLSGQPKPVDLTTNFMDIQERITSEAEASRKQQDSHYKNNQTAIKTLTGVVKKLPTAQDVIETAAINHTSTVEAIDKKIEEEHKKTRKESQEIKTRLTWSRKREKQDLEDEKVEEKQRAELYALMERIAAAIDNKTEIHADSTLPEGTMVLRDEESGDEVTVSNVTPEKLVKAAKKANKKKRKASK